MRIRTRISKRGRVYLFTRMGVGIGGIEIFGLASPVMLAYKITYHLWQLGLVGTFQTVGHMADDYAGALKRTESVVGIDAVLVLGKECGIINLPIS